MSKLTTLLLGVGATVLATPLAQAQMTTPTLPDRQIPPAVLAQLRVVENQFDLALAQDCAPERCFSKGCAYGAHAVVDQPRSTSLPGLGEEAGPGSVAPQEFLTQVRCEFAHEKSISSRDVQALVKRLEQKLSKGWMVVTVDHKVLEPISPSLRESPEPKVEPAPPPPEPKVVEVPVQKPPEKWELAVAMRELWVSLLPHFSWMIAVVLVTLAALVIIWALRRLGRESAAEQALMAQLAAAPSQSHESEEAPASDESSTLVASMPGEGQDDEARFVVEQSQLWNKRLDGAELASDDSIINDLLREWLRRGDYPMLAKAVLTFSDRLPLVFPSDGELAVRKVELADYIRTVDPERLPSDAQFFKKLNQHAISSSLLSQADAEVYRSLLEEFGPSGVVHLMEVLPKRHGALLFALVPSDCQEEVARLLDPEGRKIAAEQLLLSNRASKEEIGFVFLALRAAASGAPLPVHAPTDTIIDRGREIDAPGALSVLLAYIPEDVRSELFRAARQRSNGALPLWYEEILYADMLFKVPSTLQTDMLLDVDVRSLAGWFSLQPPSWQERFFSHLPPSMQNALRAAMAFASRADQLSLARRGRSELVVALRKLVARGQISFADVVA